jgi:hypothetical protein
VGDAVSVDLQRAVPIVDKQTTLRSLLLEREEEVLGAASLFLPHTKHKNNEELIYLLVCLIVYLLSLIY